MKAYKSFIEQLLHYFIRDHERVPNEPIVSPAAWLGSDMIKRQDEWQEQLSDNDIAEIEAAVEKLISSNTALEAVDRSNFELPTLHERIGGWRDEIASGRGFVVIRGLPVKRWGLEKTSYAWWGLGHHLGVPGAQNPEGDLLGHVIDRGVEARDPMVRRYKTTGHIDFHCDAADVVGLLCMQSAKSGGQSRIVSSVTIFNELMARSSELINRLFEPFNLDRRNEEEPGELGYAPIPPCCYSKAHGLQTTYHSEYFRSVERFGAELIDDTARQVLEIYDAIAMEPGTQLEMWLEPGDMQFLSNHTILHSRTAFEDWPEPERKRHLLRLWLSV